MSAQSVAQIGFDFFSRRPIVVETADVQLSSDAGILPLRHGTAHAALGANDDLVEIVTRLRQTWPDVRLHVRGDAGFAVPRLYELCERLELDCSFGLTSDPGLAPRPLAGLRGRHQLLRPVVRGGQENHVARRAEGAAVHCSVRPGGLGTQHGAKSLDIS